LERHLQQVTESRETVLGFVNPDHKGKQGGRLDYGRAGDGEDMDIDIATIASQHPLMTAVLTLTLAWYIAFWYVNKRGVVVGSGAAVAKADKDEAIRLARERQQAALADAAVARLAAAPDKVRAPAPAPAPKPTAMPSRMSDALARAEAEEAAKAAAAGRLAAALARAEAGGTAKAAKAVEAPTALDETAPPPPPVKHATVDDPNSYSARLARIQKGKGPSDLNPLEGHASGSSAGSSFKCTKKGG
jgi:hypothetical protein